MPKASRASETTRSTATGLHLGIPVAASEVFTRRMNNHLGRQSTNERNCRKCGGQLALRVLAASSATPSSFRRSKFHFHARRSFDSSTTGPGHEAEPKHSRLAKTDGRSRR